MIHSPLLKRTPFSKHWLFVVVFATGVGATLPVIAAFIVSCGQSIQHSDMLTDYCCGLTWAVVIGLSILVWPVSFQDRMALLLFWAVKVVMALGFMLLYEANYLLDAFNYFAETPPYSADYGRFSFFGQGQTAGTDNVLQLFWLHNLVLPYSYHTMKVSCALLGMVAVYLFYRAAVMFLGREDYRIFCCLALYPSILFWGSILGKDPIVLLGIALYCYGLVGFVRRKQARFVVSCCIGLLFATFVRMWLGPILLLPTILLVIMSLRSFRTKVVFAIVVSIGFGLMFNTVMEKLALSSVEDVVSRADFMSKAWDEGGSTSKVDAPISSIGQLVTYLPSGIFTALFRPLPGELMNPFALLSGVENVGLLFLLLRAVRRTRRRDFRDPIVLWAVVFVLIWAASYGLISYNLGATVRFRLQVLPVFFMLLLYLSRRRLPVIPEIPEAGSLS